jgi:hypothetical protein
MTCSWAVVTDRGRWSDPRQWRAHWQRNAGRQRPGHGSGADETSQDGGYLGNGGRGGYLGSGLSVLELRLLDGSSLLVVSSDAGMFVIPIEE